MMSGCLLEPVRVLEGRAQVAVPRGVPRLLGHHSAFAKLGASVAVDYDARILAQAHSGPGEIAVVAPNDLAALRAERQHGLGHDMRWQLRIEIPGRLREPRYPAVSKGDRPSAQESIRRRIRIGRKSGGP